MNSTEIKNCTRIKSKGEFDTLVRKLKAEGVFSKYRDFGLVWNTFKTNTCFITEDSCFISFEKAKELNFKID